jgi:hypothetical protein
MADLDIPGISSSRRNEERRARKRKVQTGVYLLSYKSQCTLCFVGEYISHSISRFRAFLISISFQNNLNLQMIAMLTLLIPLVLIAGRGIADNLNVTGKVHACLPTVSVGQKKHPLLRTPCAAGARNICMITRAKWRTSYANYARCICVTCTRFTPNARVTSANPTQMLRAPAERGARYKGCYFWTTLRLLYLSIQSEGNVHLGLLAGHVLY